jgi:hypothetical protein
MTGAVRATVVIPTHDHGPMLRHSVGSALAQTVDELEIFIVGDGVPDVTRDVVADFCHQDKRIRFFDNPKGPRRGELHRHAALAEARGRIVCYLCDDDLWLPEHVETMERLLTDAEFAHAYDAAIEPDQTFSSTVGDASIPKLRDHLRAGFNFVPLSDGAHLLAAYRRLPFGWRTTPEGTPTDLYMWQQFLQQPWVRCRAAAEMTVLRFPSPLRLGWSFDERLAEIERWAARMSEDGFRVWLTAEAAAWFRQETVRKLVSEVQWKERVDQLEELVAALEARVAHDAAQAADRAAVSAALAQTSQALEHACAQWGLTARRFDSVAEDFHRVEAELDRTRRTLTWRLRDRLLQVGTVRGVVRARNRMGSRASRASR